MLLGKSIMEICLSDPESIKEALDTYEPTNDNLEGSIMHILC